MFVEPAYGQAAEYQDFWAKLNRGEFVSASFKRVGKGGKEIWIQASYNPILDLNGNVMKVVKFATDITDLTEIGAGPDRVWPTRISSSASKSRSSRPSRNFGSISISRTTICRRR